MSVIPASVRCDGCGKSRVEDSNNWITFFIGVSNLLTIAKGIHYDYVKHTCGDACTLKLTQRWLSTGTLEEQK